MHHHSADEPTTLAGRALVSARGSSDRRQIRWWRQTIANIEPQAVAQWRGGQDPAKALERWIEIEGLPVSDQQKERLLAALPED